MAKTQNSEKSFMDKVKSVSTFIGASCAIVSFLWIVFREVDGYNSQKEDYPLLKKQVEAQKKTIDSLWNKVVILTNQNVEDDINISTMEEILSSSMEDVFYDGIRFKRVGEKYYYYNGGILYKVGWDQPSQRYYYTATDGKTYWCK